MDIFLKHFAAQFDVIDESLLNQETRFKELEGYGSLTALLIMSMIDEEYGVTISGDDMVKISTIGELYDLVSSKNNV